MEIFVLDLEQGYSVIIPNEFQQSWLPFSYRYYDPIIKIVASLVSERFKKFVTLKTSLLDYFDRKYDGQAPRGKSKLSVSEKNPMSKLLNTDLNYKRSLHAMQI